MSKIITAYFTENAQPKAGLTPTITIRELDPNNDANNPVVVNADSMTEIGDGWYRYTFSTYDRSKNYTIVADGGSTLQAGERYQVTVNDSYEEDITNAVWSAPTVDYSTSGTMGFVQGQTGADVQQIRTTDLPALELMIDLVRKYSSNRTKIDTTDKTLTIYDDDCSTPLRVFQLIDSNGDPSVKEVCERAPTTGLNASSTDTSPTCG